MSLFQPKLRTRPVAQLPHALVGNTVVNVSLDYAGSAVLLMVEGQPQTRHNDGMFVKTELDRPYTYAVAHHVGEQFQVHRIPDRTENFHFVQPMPGGGWLLVAARSHYRDGDPEKNAKLFGSDGTLKREFTVGDGINDVQATQDGSIWISYFDEGVFGNYGWAEPLGAPGLLRWSPTGSIKYQFEPSDEIKSIADCYALNVTPDDSAWCCYYTDFPLVRLNGNQAEAWPTPGYGSGAIALHRNHVGFMGSYNHRDRLFLCEVAEEGVVERASYRVRDAQGATLEQALSCGRGSLVLFYSNHCLSVLDLKDV